MFRPISSRRGQAAVGHDFRGAVAARSRFAHAIADASEGTVGSVLLKHIVISLSYVQTTDVGMFVPDLPLLA